MVAPVTPTRTFRFVTRGFGSCGGCGCLGEGGASGMRMTFPRGECMYGVSGCASIVGGACLAALSPFNFKSQQKRVQMQRTP